MLKKTKQDIYLFNNVYRTTGNEIQMLLNDEVLLQENITPPPSKKTYEMWFYKLTNIEMKDNTCEFRDDDFSTKITNHKQLMFYCAVDLLSAVWMNAAAVT